MTELRDRRVVFWIERVVLFLAIAYLCVHTMPRAWGKLNTDFPNYYMAARLAHEGYDTSRIYEWVWLQREKDHRSIDIPMIGLIPITSFSTLILWPLTGFSALVAKHIWIVLNLALLVPICWFLRSMTGLRYGRVVLVLALSFPLHRNLLFGQYYVFLLVLIVAACWSYLHELHILAGALIAIAAVCKIFPVLFVVFFLQRRAWRAVVSTAITGIIAVAISIAVFGWNVHRTYLHEILPWTLHGEGMPPYVTSAASISSILHYLLLSEPQWNPHPWHDSPLIYALLQPTLQMLLLAPAVLLIRRNDQAPARVLLEWSALLTASHAVSTMPASYHFVLMVFPVCVLAARMLEERKYAWLAILLIAYLGIGFPFPKRARSSIGLGILFYVPRLPLMLALLLGIYLLLWQDSRARKAVWDWTHYAWAAVMLVAMPLNIRSTFHLQQAVRREYTYRMPLETPSLLNADPLSTGPEIRYIAATQDGYHLVTTDGTASSASSKEDDLSFTAEPQHQWVEKALTQHSRIVDMHDPTRTLVEDAQQPMLSADGQSLAFVRADHGHGRLMVRPVFPSDDSIDTPLAPVSINVYEATFISRHEYALSGAEGGHPPQIYLTDQTHSNAPLALGESRYPALSPNRRWMAYSHLQDGVWNLWVRDQQTGVAQRVAYVPCNQIQPSWESDSKTLLYATDCGRSLWFTAIARRRVIP